MALKNTCGLKEPWDEANQGFPQEILMHSGWAWFGWSLRPHQRNMDIEGMGAAMLKGHGGNTASLLMYQGWTLSLISRLLDLFSECFDKIG